MVADPRATGNTGTDGRVAGGRPRGAGGCNYANAASRLFDNGYDPIPVVPSGKKPALSRWTAIAIDETAIEDWSQRFPDHSVGLRTGHLVAIDIDVLDPDLAHRLQALAFARLGDTLIRIGRYPKRLLAYRTDSPFAKMSCGKVEVLGSGQQFVAFGRHPDTGADYSWVTGDSPLDVPRDDLPKVTPEAVSALLAEMGALQPTAPPATRRRANVSAAVPGPVRNDAGCVIDGRDGWLSSIAFHAVHDALERDGVSVEAIARNVWNRFAETTDLSRGRSGGPAAYAFPDARKKVEDKLRLASQGRLPSRAADLPDPDYALPTLTPVDARTALDEALKSAADAVLSWWCGDRTGAAPQIGIRATVGLGKSTASRRHVLSLRQTLQSIGAPRRIAVFTPSHALAEETAAAWRTEGLQAAVLQGYERTDPRTGMPMCRHLSLVRVAIGAGLDVQTSACGAEPGARCPDFEGCLKQQNRREIATADVVIAPYDALFTGFARETDDFGLVIVDEGCWQRAWTEESTAVADFEARSVLELSRHASPERRTADRADLDRARRLLMRALSDAEGGALARSKLVETGLDADLCRTAARLELTLIDDPDVQPGLSGRGLARAQALSAQAKTGRKVVRAWQSMADLLDGASEHCGQLRMSGKPGDRMLHHTRLLRVHPSLATKPVLHLDATLRPRIARRILPSITVHEIDAVMPHTRVRLVTGAFGKSGLCVDAHAEPEEAARRERRLTDCVDYVRWQMLGGGKTLVITYKACEASFAGIPGVETGHFNAIAGLDRFRDVDRLIIIGRPLPGDRDLVPICGALFGKRITGTYTTALTSVWMRDGMKRAVRTLRHQDTLAEDVRQAICDDEVLQALGRGRGVNRSTHNPIEIHVLGNLALPIAYDSVVSWETVRPDIMQRMLMAGVAVDSPADAATLYPEMFTSANQAKMAFAEAGFKGENPIRGIYREMTLKSARYRRAGRGRSWQRVWWCTGAEHVVRSKMESALGDVAGWVVEAW